MASLFLCCPFAVVSADERPAALARIEKERAGWNTGRLSWVNTVSRVGRVPRYYETQHSRDDEIDLFRGDEEGVVGRDRDGKPHENGYGPIYTLVREGEQWLYFEGTLNAEVTEGRARSRGIVNMRSFGLSAALGGATVEQALWYPDGPKRRFSERKDGDQIVVSAETDEYTIRWFIAPEKGGLPVRVVLEEGGRVTNESHITLARFGDTWYPQTVEFYLAGHNGGLEPAEVIEVLDVQPNPPDLPKSGFVPADIHIDSCMNITRRDANFQPILEVCKWDGEKVVPIEEWNRRAHAGELTSGPIFNANWQRNKALGALRSARAAATQPGASRVAVVAAIETEWEAYTRRFIERYRLDGDQTQKAILHLDQAKAAAGDFASQKKDELEKLDSQRAELDALREPQRTQRARAWDDQRREMLVPLDEIFETRLKSALQKLPTRAQRRLVEPPATTRPAQPAPAAPPATRPAGD